MVAHFQPFGLHKISFTPYLLTAVPTPVPPKNPRVFVPLHVDRLRITISETLNFALRPSFLPEKLGAFGSFGIGPSEWSLSGLSMGFLDPGIPPILLWDFSKQKTAWRALSGHIHRCGFHVYMKYSRIHGWQHISMVTCR